MLPLKIFAITCAAAILQCSAAPDYDAWDRVMHAHVTLGELEGITTHVVNYTGIAADPDFTKFVDSLATADVSHLSKNETYALYMNAYNALAIKMVIDHPCAHDILGRCTGPVKSITDIGVKIYGPASSVWLKTAGTLGGKKVSLQDVEDFLRTPKPYSEDARLHACIVCASISCPNVRREAFRAERIDEQMSAQVKDMLSNTQKGLALDRESNTLTVSMIFSWYASDFKKAARSVVEFVLPFMNSLDDRKYVQEHMDDIKLAYFKYDWHANGKPPCNCDSKATSEFLA